MSKTFDQGKDEVARLCQYFSTNRTAFLTPGVKEAHVRQTLIDPFFEALGWDVRNTALAAPQYREVVLEDSLDVEGQQRAPDYAFRVGQTLKFYAEAKKCGISIYADPGPAFQLRRYGWSARVTLSLLTDFEELGIYDCTARPRQSDKASHARILYFHFNEYPDRWRELWDIFSREAVWSGAFDEYAASKRKRGTSEVDAEFLKEIEGWRDVLAHNFALRNDKLSTDDLNAAVQLTIDRVIFLRMSEDRGLEPEQQLQKLCERDNIYSRFISDLCRKADEKYNSGLFHFRKESSVSDAPDQITPRLALDDRAFKPILQSLYFSHGSPYHFGVLPVEILGTVYERFLGKVIRLTAGHRAKVEEKPEVRKAGGVYYTPKYIVDYIVQQTVGRQIEGESPARLSGKGKGQPFRVLDMACGSGSFLLGAYSCLLDHCLKWYSDNRPETHKNAVYQDQRKGDWRLTIGEKKRILTAHIFGVDIDRQAAEVSKLSLLLKVLEGENEQTVAQQMALFHERALPNLADNIKCGNSLIGSDYFAGSLLPDPEEMKRINVFDWEQGFPEAMKTGGFDAVIGNPPWGSNIDKELAYFHDKYSATTHEHTDSFKLFIERGIDLLLPAGLAAMIVPNTILRQRRLKDVRALLMKNEITSLIDLGQDVFKGVVAPSSIFVVRRGAPTASHEVPVANLAALSNAEKAAALGQKRRVGDPVKQAEFENNPDLDFVAGRKHHLAPVSLLGDFADLKCKDAGINYQRVGSGMQDKGKSDLAERLLYEGERQEARDKMYWKGSDIDRYWIAESTTRFCRTNYREFIRPNEVVRLNEDVYGAAPKILFRQTADRLIATIDYKGVWFGRSIIAITLNEGSSYRAEYCLGILNSKYFKWLYDSLAQETGRVFAQVKLAKVKQLPIRTINFSDPADKAWHDKMVQLVTAMPTLHKQLAAARSEAERTVVQRQRDATDREIDALVYELYCLAEEEIALVETSTR